MADDLERPREDLEAHGTEPHLPSPTIWPFAFAAGVFLLLVGLVVSWPVAAVGAALTVVFGFLWIREATREVRAAPAPPVAPPAAVEDEDEEEAEEPARYPRSKFLEGATVGIGGLIGGIVTLPVLGFAVAPAFLGQGYDEVDLGPLENFPQGQWVIAKFFSTEEGSDVGRRTAYIRNNGTVDQVPSFTIVSNRCVHLGCPVQPQGLVSDDETKKIKDENGRAIEITPTAPSGFGCPCHGGAYDLEGNPKAGPPVRALDRYRYSIRASRLILGEPYSVSFVENKGAQAKIHAYDIADPGVHVDGPEQFFYPYVP